MKRSLFLLASLLSITACNTDPNPAATPDTGSDEAMPIQETTPATDALPATADPNVQSDAAIGGMGSTLNEPVTDGTAKTTPPSSSASTDR